MTTNQQRSQPEATTPAGNPGNAQRSENLLPPGDDADGRFDVAEEVSLDEQSDAARRVGKAPKGATADAMGEALRDGDDGDDGDEDSDSE